LLQKSVNLFINTLFSPLCFDKITIFCNKACKFVDFYIIWFYNYPRIKDSFCACLVTSHLSDNFSGG
jgi:hypothetical protein